MKALVVVGYCLQVNSSANLCHLQYINGLKKLGYEVDLLTVSPSGLTIDNSIKIPDVSNIFEYKAALYERLGHMKSRNIHYMKHTRVENTGKTTYQKKGSNWKQLFRELLRNMYGPHRIDAGWLLRAQKFRSDTHYDIILSLSSPPASHKLTALLIQRKRLHTDKWVQIWEDPWYGEMFGYVTVKKNMFWHEEGRILHYAQEVFYVSPITLEYQKELFPQYANKMKWQPLPSYYFDSSPQTFEAFHYGYFGDYFSTNRNLLPFYEAASCEKISVTICGNSDLTLAETGQIHIFRRMPLDELHKHESKTNVLVFLCNKEKGQIPGKIYQYSATNKIVLFILDGTEEEIAILKSYFSQYGRYIFCRNNKKDICEAIERIEKRDYTIKHHTLLDAFTPERIVTKIIDGE